MMLIDGRAPALDNLAYFATTNYGAYTSFRVEAGGVRGLDLHIARLESSALALFGEVIGDDDLRAFMRTALGETAPGAYGAWGDGGWSGVPPGHTKPKPHTEHAAGAVR
jgi:branched-subunit amino acid aminotransferase/4-amino-4-deoxychorismate lyase